MKFWNHPLIKDIGPEQFGSLFRTTPASAIGIIVNSTIMAFALLQDIGWLEVALWWSANIVLAGYAIVRWHKNRHRTPVSTSKAAIRKLIITSVVFALPWAWLLVAYLGELSRGPELILIAAACGMAASGGIQLSRIYPAAITYLLILLSAGLAKAIYLATPQYYLLGFLMLSYGWFLKKAIFNSAELSLERSGALRSLEHKVTEMDRTKAVLEKIAMEDPLTSLPNRREFQARLTAAINEAKRQNSTVSLLVCDLDHFKTINDISGHAAGDTMLVAIAERLRNTMRDYDVVARVGGDEFAIIAKHHKSPKDTVDFACHLLQAVNEPVSINGRNVVPGMSIGISMFPYDANDDKSILAHADLALQRGKATGRGNYNFFDQQLKSQLSTDEALETDLRLALVEEEFELFYQPKITIRTGQLIGFEALLRWRQPDGSFAAPGEFFHVAEDRGLISYISDFITKRALQDFGAWQQQGLDPGKLSINIHPVQIRDTHQMKALVRDVHASGINPGDIFLEITESCIIGRGTENVPEMLEYLRKEGFKISLDDFGAGYASLTHLKDLPVDELKFDREFLSDLMQNASTRAIIHALVKLANSLGITTVAEGVETAEQHNVLMAIGCTAGQGFFYNRPMDFSAATRLLKDSLDNVPEPVSATARQILAKSDKSDKPAKSA